MPSLTMALAVKMYAKVNIKVFQSSPNFFSPLLTFPKFSLQKINKFLKATRLQLTVPMMSKQLLIYVKSKSPFHRVSFPFGILSLLNIKRYCHVPNISKITKEILENKSSDVTVFPSHC